MNICVFGDSITWGGYDPENGGWVNKLRNHLEERYDATTYNLGICADDSSGLLKRFIQESTPRSPDIIIIAIGANDVKHQPGVPVDFDKFKNNIQAIASKAIEFTNKVVFIGITPVDESLTTPRNKPPYNYRENKDIEECNKVINDVAKSYKLTYIPIPNTFSNSDLYDGLHPNTQGHTKIYKAIKPYVETIISGLEK